MPESYRTRKTPGKWQPLHGFIQTSKDFGIEWEFPLLAAVGRVAGGLAIEESKCQALLLLCIEATGELVKQVVILLHDIITF